MTPDARLIMRGFIMMLSNNKREPLLRSLNEIQDRLGYFIATVFERMIPNQQHCSDPRWEVSNW